MRNIRNLSVSMIRTILTIGCTQRGGDPNLPILQVRSMREHVETFMSKETLISRLTLIFGALAMFLAAIGLYGVISFNVARRTGEIGIRIALGASGTAVHWMVLRESLGMLAAGLGLVG